jgi:hypothetical protein
MTRILTTAIACASLIFAADYATAKGGPDKGGGQGQPAGQAGGKGGGQAKHKHEHKNGHTLLGAKLKQDGKHAVGKFHNRSVEAEVKGGKVTNMTAGDLPVKRVKTKTKMAFLEGGLIRAAWGGSFQLAQYDDYYYGYCFDDGYDYDCYWYPADDVDYQDYTWDDYDPYY